MLTKAMNGDSAQCHSERPAPVGKRIALPISRHGKHDPDPDPCPVHHPSQAFLLHTGKKMVLRVRKRPGMEAEDVLAPPPSAGGGSVWGKLLGGGSRAQDGVQMLTAVICAMSYVQRLLFLQGPPRSRKRCHTFNAYCFCKVHHGAGRETWGMVRRSC